MNLSGPTWQAANQDGARGFNVLKTTMTKHRRERERQIRMSWSAMGMNGWMETTIQPKNSAQTNNQPSTIYWGDSCRYVKLQRSSFSTVRLDSPPRWNIHGVNQLYYPQISYFDVHTLHISLPISRQASAFYCHVTRIHNGIGTGRHSFASTGSSQTNSRNVLSGISHLSKYEAMFSSYFRRRPWAARNINLFSPRRDYQTLMHRIALSLSNYPSPVQHH